MSTSVIETSQVALRIYTPTLHNYFLKMLVYGDPGVGKTTLAATAANCPEMSNVLLINIEGGIMSVVGAEEVGLLATPSIIDLNEWKELEQVFWYLANEQHGYRTLIIDSLSELSKVNLESVVSSQVDKELAGRGRSRNPDKKVHDDLDDIWLDDYGKSTSQMRRVIRGFRDLPMHVIFTCHAASGQDKEKTEQVYPDLTPKLRTSVLGFMDVVGFMYTVEEKTENGEARLARRLLTQPYGKWVAKDRSPGGRLGVTVDNPSMRVILDRITGSSQNGGPHTSKEGK